MTGSGISVHLLDFPKTTDIDDADILDDMKRCRQIITDALALRMQKSEKEEQIKIRQPLSKLVYDGDKLNSFYEQIIAEEVNVKRVENGKEFALDKTLTPELREEGMARELIRAVQSARKHAGLAPGDKIKLSVSIDLPKDYTGLIKSEVGAESVSKKEVYSFKEDAKLNGEVVAISLEKK